MKMQKAANPSSRLMQMQAQYQQRQMAEREHKIASLYEAQQARALERVRLSASTNGTSTGSPSPSPPAPLLTHGKVRQMFEERRSKGIDKSYPLQPLHNNNQTRKPLTSSSTSVEKKFRSTVAQVRKQNVTQRSEHRAVNGSSVKARDLNHNHVRKRAPITDNHSKTEIRTMPQNDELDRIDNNYLIQDETFPDALEPRSPTTPENYPRIHEQFSKMHEEVTRKQEEVTRRHEEVTRKHEEVPRKHEDVTRKHEEVTRKHEDVPRRHEEVPRRHEDGPRRQESDTRVSEHEPKRPPRKNTTVKSVPLIASVPVPPPRRSAGDLVTSSKRSQPSMQKATTHPRSPRKGPSSPHARPQSPTKPRSRMPPTMPAAAVESAGPGASAAGDGCAVCGRRFAPDRLAKHEEICRKTANKKRKPFDVLKHRLVGTDAEPFLNKLRKTGAVQSKLSPAPKNLNNNWRQQHKDFINAIRAAKQVQAHVAAGGKLTDLPPPPPSENPDYVQCPHCGRRFNKAAAERHIPKCATYQFNKPKPGSRK